VQHRQVDNQDSHKLLVASLLAPLATSVALQLEQVALNLPCNGHLTIKTEKCTNRKKTNQ